MDSRESTTTGIPDMCFTTILHPTDFSESATQALRLAVRFAVSYRATLHVFHAILLHSADAIRLHAEDPADTEPQLRRYVDRATEYAEELGVRPGKGLDVKVSVQRSVLVFDAIMDTIAELQPDLVVMGTHGRSGVSRFLMGSEAEKVLRHAPCHVLTVRADGRIGRPEGKFQRVLVPVDFSEHARRALEAARALVSATRGSLTLLHAMGPVPPMYYAGDITSRFQLDPGLRQRVEARLRRWAGGCEADLIVTEGPAASEIARVGEAIGADVVVMGTRGLTGLQHLLVGSVTERVCRFAKLPILTVK